MKHCPKIGDRIFYSDPSWEYGGWRSEGITGTVTRIWQEHDDVFDDDGEFVRQGPLLPESKWKVSVEVDAIPDGWAYGAHKRFVADVALLKPEATP